MLRSFTLLVFLLFCLCTSAQDKIVLKTTNQVILVNIVEVNDSLIAYTRPHEEDSVVHTLSKEEYVGFTLADFKRDQHKIKIGQQRGAPDEPEERPSNVRKECITQSILDIGFGTGANYGGWFGSKALIGRNGSGLMLGFGVTAGIPGVQGGFQGTIKDAILLNIGYGPYGLIIDPYIGTELMYGLVGSAGFKISMLRNHMFLEFSFGYGVGYNLQTFYGEVIPINKPTGSLGLNFRFED